MGQGPGVGRSRRQVGADRLVFPYEPTHALFGRPMYDNLTGNLKEVEPPMQCQICKKAGMSGNNVSHSNRHTKTRFKANVHKQTISLNGKVQRVKICSRCLRTLHKPPRVKGKSAVS